MNLIITLERCHVMYQTYKPSGKVSFVFFPILLLFLFLVIPSISFIYVYIFQHNPSIIVNGILYLFVLYLLALFGNRVCIRIGKVRNLKLAVLSGLLAGAALLYMMFACYHLFTTGDSSPERLFQTALHPGNLLESWNGLLQKGVAVTTVKGLQLFTLKGGFLIAVMIVLLLLTVAVLAITYADAAWFPFCEASKRWTVSKTIYLEYIEDKDTFIKKLAFGDVSLLTQLDVLKGVNCSHSEAELYITDKNSDFYITIENKKKIEGKTEADGTVKFKDEEIVELLKLDCQTGRILLSRAAAAPAQASAKVITEESKRNNAQSLIRMVTAAGIQLGLLVLYFLDLDAMQEFFSSGIVLFYLIINLCVFSLSLLGCFIKEDVMVKSEDQVYYNETKRYQMERFDSPLSHKIYYSIMVLTSILLLILYLGRNL